MYYVAASFMVKDRSSHVRLPPAYFCRNKTLINNSTVSIFTIKPFDTTSFCCSYVTRYNTTIPHFRILDTFLNKNCVNIQRLTYFNILKNFSSKSHPMLTAIKCLLRVSTHGSASSGRSRIFLLWVLLYKKIDRQLIFQRFISAFNTKSELETALSNKVMNVVSGFLRMSSNTTLRTFLTFSIAFDRSCLELCNCILKDLVYTNKLATVSNAFTNLLFLTLELKLEALTDVSWFVSFSNADKKTDTEPTIPNIFLMADPPSYPCPRRLVILNPNASICFNITSLIIRPVVENNSCSCNISSPESNLNAKRLRKIPCSPSPLHSMHLLARSPNFSMAREKSALGMFFNLWDALKSILNSGSPEILPAEKLKKSLSQNYCPIWLNVDRLFQ
ncbi:hypothetical protein AGLY_016906 [Aphis glycines]|uniref:Uncharacterized protein n=1 Tax=Aphis glycines TaxID=307491 RepID=A0A6G0SXJ9_APHGL|nr:hypothetical protein AGLY_016906 [Aphis glycines]